MSDTTTSVISVTEQAALEIKSVMERQNKADCHLRVYVAGGGCSGLQYGMQLTKDVEPGDVIMESQGIKVVVDPSSVQHLQGAVVDWEGTPLGGGFRIENPNSVGGCGCGQSFTPKGGEAPATKGGCGSGGCGSH